MSGVQGEGGSIIINQDTVLHSKNFTVEELAELFEVSEDGIRGVLCASRDQTETGNILNLSRQRIFQIEKTAIKKLKKAAERKLLRSITMKRRIIDG